MLLLGTRIRKLGTKHSSAHNSSNDERCPPLALVGQPLLREQGINSFCIYDTDQIPGIKQLKHLL